MLFSNENIATYINFNFEPVWVSVRPVPRVTIDFGNDVIVKRTLHGNVATYACTAEGKVLDILPGIYEPVAYLDRLEQLRLLHKWIAGARDEATMAGLLMGYHQRQLDSLESNQPHLKLTEYPMASITGAEQGTRIVLEPARRIAARRAAAHTERATAPGDSRDLAKWEALFIDTSVNEQIRRRDIHRHLLEQQVLVTPEQVTKWLYREVLHADLDDPYLGLGNVLFDNYPFANRD